METIEEIAQYDRQIRLWGMNAQILLKKSSVLLINMSPATAEVAKNITLCGVKRLSLFDNRKSSFCSFLDSFTDKNQTAADASIPRVALLNPRVIVDSIPELDFTDVEFFKAYTIVVLFDAGIDQINTINQSCRSANVKFISCVSSGLYGFFYSDLIDHRYITFVCINLVKIKKRVSKLKVSRHFKTLLILATLHQCLKSNLAENYHLIFLQ